ncbi:MAG TPA: hypothetical protein VGZ23_10205 [bacterium]|nr:hypothetical protein [bacterium]
MAEHRPAADAAGAARASQSPSQSVIYWRYLIFWLLLFGLIYFVSLYGIVAEA